MIRPSLAIVDDDPDLATLVAEIAQRAGFDTTIYNCAKIFTEQYTDTFDAIVLDLVIPDMDGVELIRFLADKQCGASLLLVSGLDAGVLHSAKNLATEQGLNFYSTVKKPFRFEQLYKLFEKLNNKPQIIYKPEQQQPPSVEELRSALTNNELVVYYQPQIMVNHASDISVEALVRWQHPVRGLLEPHLFIPIAEQYGLIDELTWHVFRQATSQCRQWCHEGMNIRVAINMSASTLKELDFPEQIEQLLEEKQLQPSHITFEVTETALMSELTTSLDILTRLRMRGFNLSIDDFGTGYSSLVQLYRAPFSELKIDRSFTKDMDENKEARAIVETSIMLAHKMGLSVVAEGVETQSVQDLLLHLDCNCLQGYYISRPIPGNEIISWVNNYQLG